MAAFTSFLFFSYVIFCSAPAPAPVCSWPGYFQGFLGPFPLFLAPTIVAGVLQTCLKHVAGVL